MTSFPLSQRILSIEESKSGQMAATITKLRKKGETIIGFNVGEPDLPTPQVVIDATKKALNEGHTRYGLVSGEAFLREAIVKKLKRDQKLSIDPDNICLSNGSKQVLYSLFQLICNLGDEIIVPKPYWVSFPESIRLAGGKPIFVESQEGNLCFENISKAISKRTKAIVINSPNNPSGLLPHEEEIKEILNLAHQKNIFIISDEAYETLIYHDAPFKAPAQIGDPTLERTFIIQSFSKSYCMTGFRLGHLTGNKEIVKAMGKLQGHICGNPPIFIQKGALAALENEDEIVPKMKDIFKRRMKMAYEACLDIFPDTKKPQGAFYLFPKIPKDLLHKFGSDENLALHILEKAKVALLPGTFFGEPGHLRICFAASEEDIEKGMKALKGCLL